MPKCPAKTTKRGPFRCVISVNCSFVSGDVIITVTPGSHLVLPGGPGPFPAISAWLFWSKAAGRTRYPFSLRNQLVQTNTSLCSAARHRPVHLPTIISEYLPPISPLAICKPGPVSRPANKQNRPRASLFIIKDDMAEAGAVYKVHLQCPQWSSSRTTSLPRGDAKCYSQVRWHVFKICHYLIWNSYICIHVFIFSSQKPQF